MQGRSERRTHSLPPASAISPAARYSILPSRDRESSGKRYDLVRLVNSYVQGPPVQPKGRLFTENS